MQEVKNAIFPVVKRNKANKDQADAYEGWYDQADLKTDRVGAKNFMSKISDIREYDVPLHVRVQIDKEIRCSFWYKY